MSQDPMRKGPWAPLSHEQKQIVATIKEQGDQLWKYFDNLGNSRELSLAKTRLEEAVMWAVKDATSPEKA
jgi:hypothetical protein